MKQLVTKVRRCEPLNEFVYFVELELPEPIEFIAGQYLTVVMGERDERPFSIASTPAQKQTVQLHIGAAPENPYAWEVIEKIRQDGELTINIPAGEAGYVANSQRPLILVAGGTGFSYTWSILQQHLASNSQRPITLYWGGRKSHDLYFHDELLALAAKDQRFHYQPVVESHVNGAWHGLNGLVIPAVLAETANLADYDIYIAGRFEMVRVARDAFVGAGLPLEQLYGDALAFI
ncbi:NAD(P)H-flavin reductase [Aliidiomarina haloalkalitolerans]|uniref:NAD(P)H-flavin reductase n=1 Tax=Aliidiomarina haloalkalitolerans TaxID=859059 RepID=A0A432VUY3_9GAMM|nr:NAD(P)H-flavin reductase [Aliidiomarina haloalkalitolerans]RUO20261.1 NAD(P)H-flavin reductase [Aliidiomarina haloalkalitolerans]